MSRDALTALTAGEKAGKEMGAMIDSSVCEKSMCALEDRKFSRLSTEYAKTFIADADGALGLTVTAETPDEDMERIDEMLYEKCRMVIRRFCLQGVAIWLLLGSLFSLATIFDKMGSLEVIACLAVVWVVNTLAVSMFGCMEARYALSGVFDWLKTRRELRKLRGERWLPYEAVRTAATAKSGR